MDIKPTKACLVTSSFVAGCSAKLRDDGHCKPTKACLVLSSFVAGCNAKLKDDGQCHYKSTKACLL